jgi:hypothetical protein
VVDALCRYDFLPVALIRPYSPARPRSREADLLSEERL